MQADPVGASYLVELRGGSKRFGETESLDQVTLRIRDGEFSSKVGRRHPSHPVAAPEAHDAH